MDTGNNHAVSTSQQEHSREDSPLSTVEVEVTLSEEENLQFRQVVQRLQVFSLECHVIGSHPS